MRPTTTSAIACTATVHVCASPRYQKKRSKIITTVTVVQCSATLLRCGEDPVYVHVHTYMYMYMYDQSDAVATINFSTNMVWLLFENRVYRYNVYKSGMYFV